MENLQVNKAETYAEKLAANKRRESHLQMSQNISQDLVMQVFAEEESESLTETEKSPKKDKSQPEGTVADQLANDAKQVYKSLKTLEMMRGDSLNTFYNQQAVGTQGNINSMTTSMFPIHEKSDSMTEEQRKLYDLMALVELKRNKKLTPEEIDYIKGLEASRAVFNVDEYVKLQDVRQIMIEGLGTVYEKLKRQDDIARDNRMKITNMANKVEACIRTVGQISKLQSASDVLFKHFKDHEMRLNEHTADKKQLKEELDAQIEKVSVEIKSLNSRVTHCEAIQDLAKMETLKTNQRVDHFESVTMENILALKQKISDETYELQQRVDQIPGFVEQSMVEIKNIKEDIETKSMEQLNSVVKALKSDEFRIQDLESKMRQLEFVKTQNATLSHSVQKLERDQEEQYQVKYFIERYLPLLIHIHLCEGLQLVSGEYMPKLKKFEQKKLQQLLTYIEVTDLQLTLSHTLRRTEARQ